MPVCFICKHDTIFVSCLCGHCCNMYCETLDRFAIKNNIDLKDVHMYADDYFIYKKRFDHIKRVNAYLVARREIKRGA